ncbi:MAG: hypothetical protein ACRC9L_09140 [Brevinema sp.]
MDQTERAMLIRRGNELLNTGDTKNALKIFLATDYKDGIARVASIFEHEKRDPVSAIKLYKKAGLNGNVEHLAYTIAQVLRRLLAEDKQDSGSKLSGRAPDMLPSEAVRIAKERLAPQKKEIVEPWRPITISRSRLEGKKP